MASVTSREYQLSPRVRFVTPQGMLTSEAFRILSAVARILESVTIEDGEVTTAKIDAGAITTDKLDAEAVTADKIDAGAVTAEKIDAGAVTTEKLDAGAVTAEKIGAGEVTAEKILVTSLEAISAVLGNVIINGTLIINGSVTTGKVAENAITDITVGDQIGGAGPNNNTLVAVTVPVAAADAGNTGVLLQFTAFMDRPAVSASNFGYWSMDLLRNGVVIESTPDLFYDDNFAYPTPANFDDTDPGIDPDYEVKTVLTSGDGNFAIYGGKLICTLYKR